MASTFSPLLSFFALSVVSLTIAVAAPVNADISRAPSIRFTLESGRQNQAEEMARELQRFAAAKGFKVLWWNIAHGELASNGITNFITQNMTSLGRSKAAPDMILFGEYSPKALDENAKNELATTYPFQVFLPYSQLQKEMGIGVFSRRPIRLGREHVLSWTPPGTATLTNSDYLERWSAGLGPNTLSFYTRTVRELIVETEQGPVTIVPVHLSEPWHSLRVRDGALKGGAEIIDQMFLGTNNPIINQIRDLVTWLSTNRSPRLVVVGDFNMPTGVLGFKTAGYKILSHSLRPVDIGSASSFPTPSSPLVNRYPPVQIDHAFTAGAIRATAGAVLPWKGSDHFPIYSFFN